MENMLSGKTAIVTGASRGIGKAIAIALGREKMRLALLARSTDQLQQVVEEIHAVGGEAVAIPCDLMDSDAVDTSIKKVFVVNQVFILWDYFFRQNPWFGLLFLD